MMRRGKREGVGDQDHGGDEWMVRGIKCEGSEGGTGRGSGAEE